MVSIDLWYRHGVGVGTGFEQGVSGYQGYPIRPLSTHGPSPPWTFPGTGEAADGPCKGRDEPLCRPCTGANAPVWAALNHSHRGGEIPGHGEFRVAAQGPGLQLTPLGT